MAGVSAAPRSNGRSAHPVGFTRMKRMSRKIVVAGNCQIGGIAAALQRIFASDEISSVAFNPHAFKGSESALSKQISQADIVLGSKHVRTLLKRAGLAPSRFVTIPGLYFSAFHPDIVGVNAPLAGRHFAYNSAICAWAFSRGLEPKDALRLYDKRTFAALGYFNRWDASVRTLRRAFEEAGLEFDRFYLAAKREGTFMYTVNHPKGSMLAWLAKMLAMELGADPSIWRRDIVFADALGRLEIWPVYPEVAGELALPGSYTWLVDRGRIIDGLPQYVNYAYSNYTGAGIAPGDLRLMGVDQVAYDAALTTALERS